MTRIVTFMHFHALLSLLLTFGPRCRSTSRIGFRNRARIVTFAQNPTVKRVTERAGFPSYSH